METVLIQTLKGIFKQFPNFWDGDSLRRSVVIDAIQKKEIELIKALINSDYLKSIYAIELDGVLVFDFDKLGCQQVYWQK